MSKILSEVDISDAPKHILLFGAPKTGKTRKALELAQRFKVKLLDLENGFKVGKQLPVEWQKNIEVFSVLDTKAKPLGFLYLLTLFKTGRLRICDAHGDVTCSPCTVGMKPWSVLELSKLTKDDVLVIDGLTQLTNSIMASMALGKEDDWVPEDYKPWRKMGIYLDMILGFIQNAPFHVVCISHETNSEMESGTEKLVPVAGTQNFSRNVAKYFDSVVYCDIVNNKHVFASKSTYKNGVLTGDRMNVDMQRAGEKGLLAIFDGDFTVDLPVVPAGTPVVDTEKSALANLLKG